MLVFKTIKHWLTLSLQKFITYGLDKKKMYLGEIVKFCLELTESDRNLTFFVGNFLVQLSFHFDIWGIQTKFPRTIYWQGRNRIIQKK